MTIKLLQIGLPFDNCHQRKVKTQLAVGWPTGTGIAARHLWCFQPRLSQEIAFTVFPYYHYSKPTCQLPVHFVANAPSVRSSLPIEYTTPTYVPPRQQPQPRSRHVTEHNELCLCGWQWSYGDETKCSHCGSRSGKSLLSTACY